MTGSIDSFVGEWRAAESAGDTGKLDSLLAEDSAGVRRLGFSRHKAERLARQQQGLSYDSFGLGETTFSARGHVVIMTARLTQRGPAFGNPNPRAVGARGTSNRAARGVRGPCLGPGQPRQEGDRVHLDGAVDIAGAEIMV